MTFIGINIFAQQIVFGLVLIAVVALTSDRTKITDREVSALESLCAHKGSLAVQS
jgi:ribose/xylose/arabinose/galactoside ABC-type transport system permease subunit